MTACQDVTAGCGVGEENALLGMTTHLGERCRNKIRCTVSDYGTLPGIVVYLGKRWFTFADYSTLMGVSAHLKGKHTLAMKTHL